MTNRGVVHIEIPTKDAKQSGDFYHQLFSWHVEREPNMDYTMWDPSEGPAGGFTKISEGAKVGEVLIYINSEDIDADLKKAASLGATVTTPKSEIPQVGWFGIFKDATGNPIALFTSSMPQQERMKYADGPKTRRDIIHIEIPAVDPKKAGEFYSKLFGWHVENDEKMNYTFWDAHDGPGGGFPALSTGSKAGEVNISVNSDDIDADLKKAVKLGGKVMIEKSEIPTVGWYGMFTDPTGNNISLYTRSNS